MTNKIESMHSEMRNLHTLIRHYNRYHARYSGRENWMVAWLFGDGDIAIYPAKGDTIYFSDDLFAKATELELYSMIEIRKYDDRIVPVIVFY